MLNAARLAMRGGNGDQAPARQPVKDRESPGTTMHFIRHLDSACKGSTYQHEPPAVDETCCDGRPLGDLDLEDPLAESLDSLSTALRLSPTRQHATYHLPIKRLHLLERIMTVVCLLVRIAQART